MSTQFQQGEGDGLLGLAFDTINTVTPTSVKTPVDNLPGAKIFTVYLGSWRDAADPDKGESFYTFGSIDQDIVGNQTILYTPIESTNGFWEYPSTSSIVNGTTIQVTGTAIAGKSLVTRFACILPLIATPQTRAPPSPSWTTPRSKPSTPPSRARNTTAHSRATSTRLARRSPSCPPSSSPSARTW